jgi:phosphopantetheine--protein transferase-like protein
VLLSGFGQAGAEVVIVHANSLWSAVPAAEFSGYTTRRAERHAAANRHWLEWLHDRRPLVAVKNAAPYADADMHAVFLSPLARATRDEVTGGWSIKTASGAGKAGAGGLGGGDKSRLNLALRTMTKNISWRNFRSSPSQQFLHVDSRGEVHSASPLPSPGSSASLMSSSDGNSSNSSVEGRVGTSRTGGMARNDSVVWTAPAVPMTNQNLNTEVPVSGNPASFGANDAGSNAQEAALNVVGLTHTLSGVQLTSAALEADSQCGVGVDVEETGTFENRDAAFLARNFSEAERAYCEAQPHPAASFAGKWAAKEAVLKALSQLFTLSSNAPLSGLSGAGAPLIDIEVLAPPAAASGQTLAPQVTLRGQAEQLAKQLNLASIQLSISHAGSHALSLAMARQARSPAAAAASSASTPGMRSAASVAGDLSKLIKK